MFEYVDGYICVCVYIHTFQKGKRDIHLIFFYLIFFYPLTIFTSLSLSSLQKPVTGDLFVYAAMDIKIQPKFKLTTTTAAISWGHFKFKRVSN